MFREKADVVIVGGGSAGLGAAIAAKEEKESLRVVVLERDEELGGVLNQCIHDGFGLELFGKSMTGPEFAAELVERAEWLGVESFPSTTALEISNAGVLACSPRGIFKFSAKAVVVATGCRERTRWQIGVEGSRPAGVYTAGCAQRLMNLHNKMVGKKAVIVGSGDVGLIMARRLVLEGAEVVGVVELMPFPGGLPRNIVQCLEDYEIPLYLNHKVERVHGNQRVEGVTIRKPNGKKLFLECDTLLISAGLIPEAELLRSCGARIDDLTLGPVVTEDFMTSHEGVFACGNVVHTHDTADSAYFEGRIAGRAAAEHAMGKESEVCELELRAGRRLRYVVPQLLSGTKIIEVKARPKLFAERVEIVLKAKRVKKKLASLPRVRPCMLLKLRLKPQFPKVRCLELELE